MFRTLFTIIAWIVIAAAVSTASSLASSSPTPSRSSTSATNASSTLWSAPRGFTGIPGAPYQYGPTCLLVGTSYYCAYCSPGVKSGDWDVIRMSASNDGMRSWKDPWVALEPQTSYQANSVCDPTIVQFRGSFFLYHTCINTGTPGPLPPDGYGNNRICVAVADRVEGPYHSPPGKAVVVIEHLSCTSNSKKAYCTGQPSAVVVNNGSAVRIYYSLVNGVDHMQPPNPGAIYAQESTDGISFHPLNGGHSVYPQRDCDVKHDRDSGLFLLVQGDVGSNVLSYATSLDGINFTAYDAAARHIATNPAIKAGESNNNPGLVGMPDGSFGGMTAVLYGSSVKPGWGDWLLYTSAAMLDPKASNCSHCVRNSCDYGCANAAGTRRGRCAVPGSTQSGDCCDCYSVPAPATCASCLGPGVAGCVAACRAMPGMTTGICAVPGGTNPKDCCECF